MFLNIINYFLYFFNLDSDSGSFSCPYRIEHAVLTLIKAIDVKRLENKFKKNFFIIIL